MTGEFDCFVKLSTELDRETKSERFEFVEGSMRELGEQEPTVDVGFAVVTVVVVEGGIDDEDGLIDKPYRSTFISSFC